MLMNWFDWARWRRSFRDAHLWETMPPPQKHEHIIWETEEARISLFINTEETPPTFTLTTGMLVHFDETPSVRYQPGLTKAQMRKILALMIALVEAT